MGASERGRTRTSNSGYFPPYVQSFQSVIA